MKSLSRVVWSEGMYLGPHHFQAQNRYFEDAIRFAAASLWREPYGLLGYRLDQEALQNGVAAVTHARGVFPDGLAFHIPEHDASPTPLDVRDVFPRMEDAATLVLTVPPVRPDGRNCSFPAEDDPGADPAGVRYVASPRNLPDENTGRDEKAIRLGRKNIRLALENQLDEDSDLVRLPLARIRPDGAGGYTYDDAFIPPVLQIEAAPPLMARLKLLIEILEEKCRSVPRPKDLGAAASSGFSAQGIANAWFLHCINQGLAPLRHLHQSRTAHPEQLFTELSRLAGALATFGLQSHPNQLPLYNHADPTECFAELDHYIRRHLELVVPSNCVEIDLESPERYFWFGEVKDQRTLNRSRWILGVYAAVGEADLIERTPRLAKICSREFLPRLVQRALPGLKLTHLSSPPPAITPKIEYQYFAVDKAGPCWEHLVKTRQLGVYVPGELPDPAVELLVVLES